MKSFALVGLVLLTVLTLPTHANIRTCGRLFVPTRVSSLRFTQPSQPRLENIQIAGRSFQVEIRTRLNRAISANDGARDVQANRHLEIRFKSLTNEDANFLAMYFGKPYGQVSGGRNVSLEKFLPRHMAHFLNKTFRTTHEDLPAWGTAFLRQPERGDQHQITTSMDCVGTAWEMLRLMNPRNASVTRIETFFSTAEPVKDILRDPKYSKPISAAELKFGDLVLIGKKYPEYTDVGQSSLYHAAIYLGGGFVFEKIGTNQKYGFRIIDLNTDLEGYAEVIGRAELDVEYRRFNGPNDSALPAPSDILTVNHTAAPELLANMPVRDRDSVIVNLEEVGLMGRLEAVFGRIVREIIPREAD